MSGLSTLGGLDPGIERAVNLLREARVETFESCEGGAGHAFPEPTIRFGMGRPEEGWKAGTCLAFGLLVTVLRLVWYIELGHHPTGPYWELTFKGSV